MPDPSCGSGIATYTTAHRNTRSLTHWVRPGSNLHPHGYHWATAPWQELFKSLLVSRMEFKAVKATLCKGSRCYPMFTSTAMNHLHCHSLNIHSLSLCPLTAHVPLIIQDPFRPLLTQPPGHCSLELTPHGCPALHTSSCMNLKLSFLIWWKSCFWLTISSLSQALPLSNFLERMKSNWVLGSSRKG